MKINKRNESGITLIVLVITIVVLLILAGVTINFVIKPEGIVEKAQEAKSATDEANEKEIIEIAYQSVKVVKLEDMIEAKDLQDELDKSIPGKTDVTTISEGVFNVYFKDTNNNYKVKNGEAKYLEITPEGYIAKIGTTYYQTIQAAINSISADNTQTTIVLLADTSENISVIKNQNIELNLNDYTITNLSDTPIITTSGTLSLKDGGINGAIANEGTLKINGTTKITSASVQNVTLLNSSGATVIMTGGTINSENSNAINNYGTLIVSGTSKINSTATGSVPTIYNQNQATAIITGGTITSANANAIYNLKTLELGGTVKISSNSSTSSTIYNQTSGIATITGGTITSISAKTINNYGILIVSGNAKVSSTNSYAIYNREGGTATITGGTMTSTNSYAIYNEGTATVTGATVNGEIYGID